VCIAAHTEHVNLCCHIAAYLTSFMLELYKPTELLAGAVSVQHLECLLSCSTARGCSVM
jgi:hypothetical protein